MIYQYVLDKQDLLYQCYQRGVVVLGCGQKSVRFRSPLTITPDEIDQGVQIIQEAIHEVEQAYGPLESREAGFEHSIFEGEL